MPTRFRKILQRGSRGELVRDLQQVLADQGYSVSVDGDFGPGTETAVRRFQADHNLTVDGRVGKHTFRILNQKEPAPQTTSSPIANISIADALTLFPGALQRNVEAHLPNTLQAMIDQEIGDKTMVLMALATIRAESAGFVPIKEFKSKYNTPRNGLPYSLYDYRSVLGNLGPTDGADFCGRGFIQLTGRYNYNKYGKRLNIDLINIPEQANDSKIAAQILALFLKDKEETIRKALSQNDFKTARKAVNGGRHGLSAFTDCFKKGRDLLVDW